MTAIAFTPDVARQLNLDERAVAATLRLLTEGATVPFIARYRKEATGGLDEEQIRHIEERHGYLTELATRRDSIEKEIAKQGKLTDELRRQLRAASTKTELEDLYLPFKPKRRTRATIARERGLEPLAEAMWNQGHGTPAHTAGGFVDASKDVPNVETALSGARDICSERLAERAALRRHVRDAYRQHSLLQVKKTKAHRDQRTKFDNYAEFSAKVNNLPSHRVLAIERGETEGVLKARLELDLSRYHAFAAGLIPLRRGSPWAQELQAVVDDALTRLVAPSAQSDCRAELKSEADRTAVEVFARNLRELLLASPFGEKPVLGIDPGQRTGCKCAVVSDTGKLLEHDTLYLVSGDAQLEAARRTLRRLVGRHSVQAVAVGNGTHGRETERFVGQVLRDSAAEFERVPVIVSVSESGASIYSASDIARQEFPNLDLTVRGAISIARRLQDPLAELVKLDPKTIGVGQYQHDVDQSLLASKLAEVVETCVNGVGVHLNTASAPLLSFVAGIGPKLAQNIVAHRNAIGGFADRRQLLDVKGLGPKAFEQAAGFLRIRAGQPLDASGVHPERYPLVERMARDLGVPLKELIGNAQLVSQIDVTRYRTDEVGDFTLQHIAEELAKPGRDPRTTFEAPRFKEGIDTIEDLAPGMQLEGIVTNVTAFGAFVDVGVHQDGLVHISQLADRFVREPSEVARVGQRMNVKVLDVDRERNRISLSAKGLN